MEIILKDVNYNNILKHIDMNIESGITGIVGASGSGKSLLLKIIAKDIKSTSGDIKIQKKIGYVDCINFKKKNMIVYNYLKNILLEKEYHLESLDKRIKDALLMVGLSSYQGFNIMELSRSEIIRLSLASILIYNPKVLIIDEPFIFLDNNNLDKIMRIIRLLKVRYKKTIIIATKNLDVLHKIVDRIYVLYRGEIIISGDKYSVFTNVKALKKCNLICPNVVNFSHLVYEKKNIKIGYRDEINDLIKDIYRYVK